MLTIGVDVDETLSLGDEILINIINERHNTNYTYKDIDNWDWKFWSNKEKKYIDFIDIIYEHLDKEEVMLNYTPNLRLISILNILKIMYKYKLYVVTSRNIKHKENTIKYINNYNLEYDDIYFLKQTNKSEICDILIDDSPICIDDFKNKDNKYLILFNRPYNINIDTKEYKNIFRVDKTDEIVKILKCIIEGKDFGIKFIDNSYMVDIIKIASFVE